MPSSDVDVLLVVSGEQDVELKSLAPATRHVAGLRTDFILRSMDFYRRNGGPPLSETGLHVFGADVAPEIPPEDFESYFVRKVLGFVNYQRIIRGTEGVLQYPVEPPCDARFSRYEVHRLLTETGFHEGFRTLINLITQGSTVLVGVRTGSTIYSKKQSIDAYAALDDEPFTGFVHGAYYLLNQKLQYGMPVNSSDIVMAAEICTATPAFENYVLMAVRDRFEFWPSLDPDPLHRQMMATLHP